VPDEKPDIIQEQKIEEALKKLSYESMKLWQEQQEKSKSNPLRSGQDEQTEGIP